MLLFTILSCSRSKFSAMLFLQYDNFAFAKKGRRDSKRRLPRASNCIGKRLIWRFSTTCENERDTRQRGSFDPPRRGPGEEQNPPTLYSLSNFVKNAFGNITCPNQESLYSGGSADPKQDPPGARQNLPGLISLCIFDETRLFQNTCPNQGSL